MNLGDVTAQASHCASQAGQIAVDVADIAGQIGADGSAKIGGGAQQMRNVTREMGDITPNVRDISGDVTRVALDAIQLPGDLGYLPIQGGADFTGEIGDISMETAHIAVQIRMHNPPQIQEITTDLRVLRVVKYNAALGMPDEADPHEIETTTLSQHTLLATEHGTIPFRLGGWFRVDRTATKMTAN